jgi:DNA-binding NarL/FixJ family response regulator
MKKKITIGIAEDHKIVRQGFVRMLSDQKHIKILFEADNGEDLLKHLETYTPSIILLDIAMPVMDGLKAMEVIRLRFPELKIIVISGYSQDPAIIEYVKAGANSFLPKDCDIEMLVKAIQDVSKRGFYFDTNTAKLLDENGIFQPKEFTEKEMTILRLVCANKLIAEIADLTGIEEPTVRWYKHRILKKTECKDESSLIAFAKQNKLI